MRSSEKEHAMAEQSGSNIDIDEGQVRSVAEDAGSDPIVLASAISILLSLYLFYVEGNKQQGVFVGHWAPTFLAIGSYLRQKDVDEQLDRAV
jgi:hypothetical protein